MSTPEPQNIAAQQDTTSTQAVSATPQATAGEMAAPVAWLQWIYLGLAICGAVFPWLANLNFIREHGNSFDFGLFFQLANANDPARSLARDLAISASAVSLWIVIESRRLAMRHAIWPLLGCFLIDFAFGAPLFLFLRERRLLEISKLHKAQSKD